MSFSEQDKNDLLKAIESGSPKVVVNTLARIEVIKQKFTDRLLNELHEQCIDLCAKSRPSILRRNNFQGMTNINWNDLVKEMSSHCPLLFHVLRTVMGCTTDEGTVKVAPRLGLCYAVMLQTRNHELSLVQRLNTILLAEGNAKKKVNNLFFIWFHINN